MATQIYVINNTKGDVITSVQPGATNGPGSAQQTTDLKLFGLGTQRWGEGFDENFVRLTENFAVPHKLGFPNIPQDATDLGTGNGINKPLNGQLWFNTTLKILLVFDASLPGWKSIGDVTFSIVPPLNPQPGDLWFDTAQQQLKVFNGVSFVSVAARYLLKSGDAMTAGFLTLFQNPTAALHAATKGYVDAADMNLQAQIDALDTRIDALETAPPGLTQAQADGFYVNVTGDTMTGSLIMSGASTKITLPNAPLIGTDAANKTYVDTKVTKTGDSMSGILSMGGNKITNLGTPLASTDAATKAYVDAAVAAVSGGLRGSMVNASGIRNLNTTYTNSFGKDILVIVSASSGGGDTRGFVNGIEVVINAGSLNSGVVVFVVDAGASYRVNTSGLSTLIHWYEYR